MVPFFLSGVAGSRLIAAAERWSNTPFAKRQAVCGKGVDCVHLIREVWRECGVDVLCAGELPDYSFHHGRFHENSQLLQWLEELRKKRNDFIRVDVEDPLLAGDMVLFRVHLSCHHAGVLLPNDDILHAEFPGGVTRLPLREVKRRGKLQGVRRVLLTE